MSSPPNNPQDPSRPDQPGLWTAHAEYIKGAAERSTIGNKKSAVGCTHEIRRFGRESETTDKVMEDQR
ncbi:predicted protein [Chaetomium globosum CBS 148.51]|uniref:Uncharacterized protein n=1 Tax=Chaetomium globosum (strain ATCC 6205 / CBS 148.51 / DSM 1962 / NBRC 6347 / NRRL 1970) TaxID=306901 RepID=Q2GZS0_CHAGB|nr:uncharacterized protein CHGG_04976 [Chaetomium globosum CBS 148.51]EAQ88357.1 predicted protein [Chaetomium globosum CBS 148.51]